MQAKPSTLKVIEAFSAHTKTGPYYFIKVRCLPLRGPIHRTYPAYPCPRKCTKREDVATEKAVFTQGVVERVSAPLGRQSRRGTEDCLSTARTATHGSRWAGGRDAAAETLAGNAPMCTHTPTPPHAAACAHSDPGAPRAGPVNNMYKKLALALLSAPSVSAFGKDAVWTQKLNLRVSESSTRVRGDRGAASGADVKNYRPHRDLHRRGLCGNQSLRQLSRGRCFDGDSSRTSRGHIEKSPSWSRRA